MRPVYVIIDEKARDDFEKEWGISYGYADSEIFTDFEDAVIDFEDFVDDWETNYIIEKIDSEGREIVYRK